MTINQILEKIKRSIRKQEELDYFNIHCERYRYILEKISRQPKKGRILDIGCYPLHLSTALKEMGFSVYGVSSFHEPINQTKRVKILNIETDKLPFTDNKFDLVLFSEVIEHLYQSPKFALKEIKRVLKKNGQLIITTPNVARSINRLFLLMGKNIYPAIDDFFDDNAINKSLYFRHNREYTMAEIKRLVEESGLSCQEKNFFISYTPFRKKRKKDNPFLKLGKFINYLLMLIFPPLRDTLYLRAVKN